MLNDSQEYDIIDLWAYRFVLPRATGHTITQVNAEVQNLTGKCLRVVVRPGTYFVACGGHQNMVTYREHRFLLPERGTARFSVPAACINAELPIPREGDHFRGVARVSEDLRRFLERADGEDPMVIQAGV
jgi:hypothetical protein